VHPPALYPMEASSARPWTLRRESGEVTVRKVKHSPPCPRVHSTILSPGGVLAVIRKVDRKACRGCKWLNPSSQANARPQQRHRDLGRVPHLFLSLAEQLRSDLDAAYREAKSRAPVVDSWCDDAPTVMSSNHWTVKQAFDLRFR